MTGPSLAVRSASAVLAIAAAVGLAAPLTMEHEGYRGAAYLDPAGILTQCYGETEGVDPSRIYSRDECAVKLRRRQARDYAPPLLACMPVLVDRRLTPVFAALLDAAYNTGPRAVCAKFAGLVNAGRHHAACEALPGWYVTARDRRTGVRKRLPGLVRRRLDERALCLQAAGDLP